MIVVLQARVNTVPRNRANTLSVSVSYLWCCMDYGDIYCRSSMEAQPISPRVNPLPLV